jgi:hypothetical protein
MVLQASTGRWDAAAWRYPGNSCKQASCRNSNGIQCAASSSWAQTAAAAAMKAKYLPTAADQLASLKYKKSDAFIGVVTHPIRWNSIYAIKPTRQRNKKGTQLFFSS